MARTKYLLPLVLLLAACSVSYVQPEPESLPESYRVPFHDCEPRRLPDTGPTMGVYEFQLPRDTLYKVADVTFASEAFRWGIASNTEFATYNGRRGLLFFGREEGMDVFAPKVCHAWSGFPTGGILRIYVYDHYGEGSTYGAIDGHVVYALNPQPCLYNDRGNTMPENEWLEALYYEGDAALGERKKRRRSE